MNICQDFCSNFRVGENWLVACVCGAGLQNCYPKLDRVCAIKVFQEDTNTFCLSDVNQQESRPSYLIPPEVNLTKFPPVTNWSWFYCFECGGCYSQPGYLKRHVNEGHGDQVKKGGLWEVMLKRFLTWEQEDIDALAMGTQPGSLDIEEDFMIVEEETSGDDETSLSSSYSSSSSSSYSSSSSSSSSLSCCEHGTSLLKMCNLCDFQ